MLTPLKKRESESRRSSSMNLNCTTFCSRPGSSLPTQYGTKGSWLNYGWTEWGRGLRLERLAHMAQHLPSNQDQVTYPSCSPGRCHIKQGSPRADPQGVCRLPVTQEQSSLNIQMHACLLHCSLAIPSSLMGTWRQVELRINKANVQSPGWNGHISTFPGN